MPPRKTSSGICTYCLAPIAKPSRSILDHITGCPEQKVIDENLEYSDHLIMMIEGEDPNYWMIIKTLPNNTLTRLDTFLRNIWVECCGHMSEFSYGTTSSGGTIGKSQKLGDIFERNEEFFYTYDFGTPTNIRCKLLGIGLLGTEKGQFTVLMRNEAPQALCMSCTESAQFICSYCLCENKNPYICENCQGQHECVKKENGETYMLMDVVNSPRMGECGYCGYDLDDVKVKKYFPRGIIES